MSHKEQVSIPAFVELEDGRFVSTAKAMKDPELREKAMDAVIGEMQGLESKIEDAEGIIDALSRFPGLLKRRIHDS